MPARSPRPGSRGRGWPSVEDQLREAKVTKGSALENLVRENQDASVLHPEEAPDDALGLPLWLRVNWRKTHPDLEISSVDPFGAYPDVLHRIYQWMLAHQDLPEGPPGEGASQGSSRD
jgi:hypothetical protein